MHCKENKTQTSAVKTNSFPYSNKSIQVGQNQRETYDSDTFLNYNLNILKRKQTKEFYGFCKRFVWRFLKSIFISVATLYLEVTGNKLKTEGHACPSKSC